MFNIFRRETPEEKIIRLKCEIAVLEKEVEVLWKIENEHNYIIGKRNEIIAAEKKLAYKSKLVELQQGQHNG